MNERGYVRRRFLALPLLGLAAGTSLVSSSRGAMGSASGAGSTPLAHPAPAGARLPRLNALPGGGLILSWVEPVPGGHALKFSVLRDARWDSPIEVARGPRWFVNWADFPSVVAIDASFWVAHWLVRQAQGSSYDYDIALAWSNDTGRTWSAPITPHRDGKAAEHGFVSIFPAGSGAGLVWLDGRDYAKPSPLKKVHDAHHSANFALRYTTLGRDGRLGTDVAIDDNVCSCCQTAVASTPQGPMVAYRGRTDQEIRDNLTARLIGGRWQRGPVLGPDRWRIAACPVNGPAIAARGSTVLAAWFTGAGNRGRVLAALSSNAGASFERPVELDGRDPVGRVSAVWTDSDHAAVGWISAPDDQGFASLCLARVRRDGRAQTPRIVARVSADRDSGFPQLAAHDQRLVVAWTERGPGFGIRVASMPTN